MAEPQVCMACGMDPIEGRRTQLNPPDPRYALCPTCADPASWVGDVIHPPNACRICGPRESRLRRIIGRGSNG